MAENFKRAHFRVEFTNLPADIEFFSKTEEKIEKVKTYKGQISDASGGGLSLSLGEKVELYGQENYLTKVSFILENTQFSFEAILLKEQVISPTRVLYGCKFENVSKEQQSKLIILLLRIDTATKKKKLEQLLKNYN